MPRTVDSLCSAQVPVPSARLPARHLRGVGHRVWASQVLSVGINEGGNSSAPGPDLCDEGMFINLCRINKRIKRTLPLEPGSLCMFVFPLFSTTVCTQTCCLGLILPGLEREIGSVIPELC